MLYLTIIKDVFSRKIVGWSTSARQGSELMVRELQKAVSERSPQRGVIHHSDHGTQYTSTAYRTVCQAAANKGTENSMPITIAMMNFRNVNFS